MKKAQAHGDKSWRPATVGDRVYIFSYFAMSECPDGIGPIHNAIVGWIVSEKDGVAKINIGKEARDHEPIHLFLPIASLKKKI